MIRRKLGVHLGVQWTLTLAAGSAWFAAFQSRETWISPACQQTPDRCQPGLINGLDRSVLINYDASADFWSFVTQDLAGALALACCVLWAVRKGSAGAFLSALTLTLQATFANGLFNECIRLWIQRPRPFVYLDPIAQGGAAAHYTSFYSGHTSFAAVASTCAWLLVRQLGLSPSLTRSVVALGALLTLATAALRVLAGRHFITDTLAGALFGASIAFAIYRLHEKHLAVR